MFNMLLCVYGTSFDTTHFLAALPEMMQEPAKKFGSDDVTFSRKNNFKF